jgi:hypothetical protein
MTCRPAFGLVKTLSATLPAKRTCIPTLAPRPLRPLRRSLAGFRTGTVEDGAPHVQGPQGQGAAIGVVQAGVDAEEQRGPQRRRGGIQQLPFPGAGFSCWSA